MNGHGSQEDPGGYIGHRGHSDHGDYFIGKKKGGRLYVLPRTFENKSPHSPAFAGAQLLRSSVYVCTMYVPESAQAAQQHQL